MSTPRRGSVTLESLVLLPVVVIALLGAVVATWYGRGLVATQAAAQGGARTAAARLAEGAPVAEAEAHARRAAAGRLVLALGAGGVAETPEAVPAGDALVDAWLAQRERVEFELDLRTDPGGAVVVEVVWAPVGVPFVHLLGLDDPRLRGVGVAAVGGAP